MNIGQKFVFAAALSAIFTLLSYFRNNAGVCCDLIFEAGWPRPFYGGSGGFVGEVNNTVMVQGLLIDLAFWGIISFVLLKILIAFKKNQ